jgi:hypothetical protein
MVGGCKQTLQAACRHRHFEFETMAANAVILN